MAIGWRAKNHTANSICRRRAKICLGLWKFNAGVKHAHVTNTYYRAQQQNRTDGKLGFPTHATEAPRRRWLHALACLRPSLTGATALQPPPKLSNCGRSLCAARCAYAIRVKSHSAFHRINTNGIVLLAQSTASGTINMLSGYKHTFINIDRARSRLQHG